VIAAKFLTDSLGISYKCERKICDCAVVGKINHFIFKALIFWEKVEVSLAFEN
jgi:hypothetical protein